MRSLTPLNNYNWEWLDMLKKLKVDQNVAMHLKMFEMSTIVHLEAKPKQSVPR